MADTMLEPSEAPRRVFERIVLRRGSLRGLGQRCGRSTMWIWRQLRQNKGVDLVKTGKVLDQLGVPIRFFYEEILDQTPEYDPAWLLEHYREGNGIPRDPFLAAVHDRLLNLLDQVPTARSGDRRRTEIDALEEERFFDREKAKTGLERLGYELLPRAEAASALNPGHLADLAYLLLVWASIQRSRGRRDDCTDGYILAYRVAVAGRDPRTIGIFFYFASHLLSELGQPAHGLRFAEQACATFQQLRDRDLLAQALVQNGIALFDLGRFDLARTKAIAALRLSSRNKWRTRFGAWLQLGNLALSRGQLRTALGKLERAEKHVAKSTYVQGFVLWRQATVFGRLGRTHEATLTFRRAIDLFDKLGQPLDVAFVAIDLAETLMSAGLFSETLVMARGLTPYFEKLGNNAQALSLWLDLVALILKGSRVGSLAQVVLLRQALRTADPKIRLQK